MTKGKRWCLWLFALVCLTPAVWGQRPQRSMDMHEYHSHKPAEGRAVEEILSGNDSTTPEINWDRLAGGMAVVLALLCVSIYGLKKLRASSLTGVGRYLQVLESRSLGHKRQLLLIRVGARIVLIACTGDTIKRVAEFEQEELPGEEENAQTDDKNRFARMMDGLVGGSE